MIDHERLGETQGRLVPATDHDAHEVAPCPLLPGSSMASSGAHPLRARSASRATAATFSAVKPNSSIKRGPGGGGPEAVDRDEAAARARPSGATRARLPPRSPRARRRVRESRARSSSPSAAKSSQHGKDTTRTDRPSVVRGASRAASSAQPDLRPRSDERQRGLALAVLEHVARRRTSPSPAPGRRDRARAPGDLLAGQDERCGPLRRSATRHASAVSAPSAGRITFSPGMARRAREMLHGLVGGPVLAHADGVVREDVDRRSAPSAPPAESTVACSRLNTRKVPP